jgi:hypothetical protein
MGTDYPNRSATTHGSPFAGDVVDNPGLTTATADKLPIHANLSVSIRGLILRVYSRCIIDVIHSRSQPHTDLKPSLFRVYSWFNPLRPFAVDHRSLPPFVLLTTIDQ